MKKLLTTLLATAVIGGSVFSSNLVAGDKKMNISNKEKAVALLNSIETGDHDAIAYVNAKNYTQHNLAVGDGLAGFGEALSHLPKDSAKVSIKRSFEDGEYVITHTDYNFFGPKVGFDLFRFEDGLIVEHWDNLGEKADKPNPSGRTQLDGVTEISDLNKTEANKTVVKNFVNDILVKGDMSKLGGYFDGDDYLQHNTNIADGLSGLGQALKAMAEHGIKMIYTTNHKVLGQGNFVLSISEGTFADKPTSFYDLFRVENGKIAEHWDVIETIIAKDQWKHSNGKFGNL